jgi:hypothetical protein
MMTVDNNADDGDDIYDRNHSSHDARAQQNQRGAAAVNQRDAVAA